MSDNLKKCLNKIQIIAGIKNKELREQISRDLCDDCLYNAIHEIALNTVTGKLKLNNKLKKKLLHNKKLILSLATKTKGKQKRKQLVVQSGGYLSIILPALISALGAYGALRKD